MRSWRRHQIVRNRMMSQIMDCQAITITITITIMITTLSPESCQFEAEQRSLASFVRRESHGVLSKGWPRLLLKAIDRTADCRANSNESGARREGGEGMSHEVV